MSAAPNDLACELLAQSLAAWRVAGSVARASDGALVIGGNKDIRIERAPPHSMFRWTVTVDGRNRPRCSGNERCEVEYRHPSMLQAS